MTDPISDPVGQDDQAEQEAGPDRPRGRTESDSRYHAAKKSLEQAQEGTDNGEHDEDADQSSEGSNRRRD